MSRQAGIAAVAAVAVPLLLPAAALAFNPQPEPPGKLFVDPSNPNLGGPDTKAPRSRRGTSVNVPAVQLPAVQKIAKTKVTRSPSHAPLARRRSSASGASPAQAPAALALQAFLCRRCREPVRSRLQAASQSRTRQAARSATPLTPSCLAQCAQQ